MELPNYDVALNTLALRCCVTVKRNLNDKLSFPGTFCRCWLTPDSFLPVGSPLKKFRAPWGAPFTLLRNIGQEDWVGWLKNISLDICH